jgi:hypothetical protein
MPKISWADMADEEELKSLEIPVVISKHGIKVKKSAPQPRPDKSSECTKGKKNDS